jgi:flagellar hook-associated protein 3 FlgL
MTVRIGTANYFARNLINLQDRQVDLDRSQQELATGKKIIRPSDDPTGANTMIQLRKELRTSDRYIASQDSVLRYNNVTESSLDAMNTTLFRAKELLAQSINGAMDTNALNAIAEELRSRSTEFFSQSNSKNANGDYIFSGYQSNVKAYEKDAFGFAQYQGDEGVRDLLVGPDTYIATNDPGSDFIDKVQSRYGYFESSSEKLSIGVVKDPSEYRLPAFPQATYQVQFNATGDGYDVVDLSLAPANQVVKSVTGYLAGDPIVINGMQFKTNASNPPVGNENIDLTFQSNSEIDQYQIDFVAAGQYTITDVNSGRIVVPVTNYVMGDTIEYRGVEFPSDPAGTAPAVGDSLSFGIPSKNTNWIFEQSIESMGQIGANFTLEANVGNAYSTDFANPPGQLLPANHPLFGANPGTTGNMTIPANTGNASISTTSIDEASELPIGDYRMSFLDSDLDGTVDTVQLNEIDPVTKRLKPLPDGASASESFTPGQPLKIAGIEFLVAGTIAVGDTFEVNRPASSERVELLGTMLEELDSAQIAIENTRAALGARLNIVENFQQQQSKFQEATYSALANIEEVDIYTAVNNLERDKVGLQAAQQSFAKIQNLSLFNYL